jgi:hypothetical protein
MIKDALARFSSWMSEEGKISLKKASNPFSGEKESDVRVESSRRPDSMSRSKFKGKGHWRGKDSEGCVPSVGFSYPIIMPSLVNSDRPEAVAKKQ